MEPVVEPNRRGAADVSRPGRDGLGVGNVDRPRLLDEEVLAVVQGEQRRRGELVVRRRDDNEGHVVSPHRLLGSPRDSGIRYLPSEVGSPFDIGVVHRDQPRAGREGRDPLAPDQPAAEYGHAGLGHDPGSFTSSYSAASMRRNV